MVTKGWGDLQGTAGPGSEGAQGCPRGQVPLQRAPASLCWDTLPRTSTGRQPPCPLAGISAVTAQVPTCHLPPSALQTPSGALQVPLTWLQCAVPVPRPPCGPHRPLGPHHPSGPHCSSGPHHSSESPLSLQIPLPLGVRMAPRGPHNPAGLHHPLGPPLPLRSPPPFGSPSPLISPLSLGSPFPPGSPWSRSGVPIPGEPHSGQMAPCRPSARAPLTLPHIHPPH